MSASATTVLSFSTCSRPVCETASSPVPQDRSTATDKAMSGRNTDFIIIDRFREDSTGADVSSELYSYLASMDGFIDEDIYHAWRQTALPPLLNCSIEIALVSGNSPEIAGEMAKAATDAMEFLGYNSADGFLSTLRGCFRDATGPDSGFVLMEKHFLLPLWKRNSAERLDLLLLGMKNSRLLTDILDERLSIEDRSFCWELLYSCSHTESRKESSNSVTYSL